jgi:VanZ family protein
MTVRLKSLLWTWFPLLVWLVIILVESTDMLSAAHTGNILYKLLNKLFGPLSHHSVDVLNAILRKSGHFIGYGILGLLFFRAIKGTILELKPTVCSGTESLRRLSRHWATGAVLCTAVVASLDEWHQTFIPTRTGAFHDVVLDTLGAVILLGFVMVRYSRLPAAPSFRSKGGQFS